MGRIESSSQGRWGANRYVTNFGARNLAHLVGKGSLGVTIVFNAVDPNRSKWNAGRDVAAGYTGSFGGPPGAVGAAVYIAIDSTYPGGIGNYAIDYMSACTEPGC